MVWLSWNPMPFMNVVEAWIGQQWDPYWPASLWKGKRKLVSIWHGSEEVLT